MKKRFAALFLAALLTTSGCGQDIPEEPPEELVVDDSAVNFETIPEAEDTEGQLPQSFTLPYDPGETLDPLTCPDGPQQVVASLLYEGLFVLDESLQPQKMLCADFTRDETNTLWTFRLREDAYFSDGSLLTAADAAASLNRARETDRYRTRLSLVTSVTAEENAVTVTLSSPNALFHALLDIPIVKMGTESKTVPLGTGPYCMADTTPVLIPSPYRQTLLPLNEIHLSAYSGSTALQHQFSSHQIQLLTSDLTSPNSYLPNGQVEIRDIHTTILQFIGFNTANPLFSSHELRHALGLGIDRETLVSAHLAGHAIAAQSPISPLSPLYPQVLDTPYSESAFLDAMTNAGYNTGSTVPVTLLVNGDNAYKVSAAEYIAKTLSVCDVQITVKALPWEEYCSALALGEFDLYYGETRLTADWDLSSLVGQNGALNYGGYSDAGMTLMLSQLASASDTTSAARMLCRYLQAQAPILPLCFKCTSVLTETGVVDGLVPTVSTPFYSLDSITIHISENN